MGAEHRDVTSRRTQAAVLLDVLNRAGTGAGGLHQLLTWCSDQLPGVTVRLIPPDAGPDEIAAFGERRDEVEALRQGRAPGPVRAGSALVISAGRRDPPRPLILADGPVIEAQLPLPELTGTAAGLLTWAQELAGREEKLSLADLQARVFGLHYLMIGDLVGAGHVLEPLVPGLVSVGAGVVAIGAAESLMGWSRQTLVRRMDDLADRTGVDLSDTSQRSALYLAARLSELPPPAVLDKRVRLHQVLDHEVGLAQVPLRSGSGVMPRTGSARSG